MVDSDQVAVPMPPSCEATETEPSPRKSLNATQPLASTKDAAAEKTSSKQERILDVPPITDGIVGRVFRLARFEYLLILFGTIAAIGEGLMPIVFYWLFGDLVAVLATPTAPAFIDQLNRVCAWMAGIAGIAGVSGFVKELCLGNASTRIGIKVRAALFRSLVKQEIGFFDSTKTGTLLSILSEDMVVLQDAFGSSFGKAWQFLSQFISGIIMSFTRSWQMSLVILGAGPLLGIALGIQSKLQARFTVQTTEASARAVSTAEEVLTSMRTIRSFGAETRESDRFSSNLDHLIKIARSKGLLGGIGYGLVMFFIWGAAALAFWFGGTMVSQSRLQVGDVVTVFGLMLMAVLGLAQGVGVVPEFVKSRTAAGNIFALIERKPHINFQGGSTIDNVRGEIEFRNVHFRYPSREQAVLKGISFKISPGKKVAFVGSSGSGKSTVFNLLQRFYDVGDGQVLFDGVDVRELEPHFLRSQLATVAQEPVLFAASIADNIRYAYPDASIERVMQAADKANAHKFITRFENGYDTLIGERGVTLSGGQKQRVAIARAVLADPKVLLLDEATSSLDTESEQKVQEALDVVMQGRTSLVIAHRLATVRDADVILVMHQGEIVEVGTHTELLANENGLYRKLAARQLLSTEIAPDSVQPAVEALPVVPDERCSPPPS